MNPDITRHTIGARSFFFGAGCFLILPLPKEWGITKSYLEPDVHSTVQGKDLIWIEAGQTDQIIFHPLKRIALDLTILIKRGRHDNLQTKDVQITYRGSQMVGGHEANYCIGDVKYGFLKKKTAKTLRLSFFCSELRRTVNINFMGKCQENDLLEICECLAFLECH